VTTNELAAITEVKSALDAIEGLFVLMRENKGPLTQERVSALGLALAFELHRVVQAQPYLPAARASEAA
jgi:hypothetical protein